MNAGKHTKDEFTLFMISGVGDKERDVLEKSGSFDADI